MLFDIVSYMYVESLNIFFLFLLWDAYQVVRTNQFSVTKHKRVIRQVSGEHGLPGMV